MSTYWGYACKTDGDTSPYWFNHGQAKLRTLASLTSHFKAMSESGVDILINVPGAHDWPEPNLWLVEHHDHDLELINEYNEREPLEPPMP